MYLKRKDGPVSFTDSKGTGQGVDGNMLDYYTIQLEFNFCYTQNNIWFL